MTTLRRAVQEVLRAIEGGEARPEILGRKAYRQEFGDAFLDMLRAALSEEESNTCSPSPPFTVGEPVVDAVAGKVTVDVGLRLRGEFGHVSAVTENRPYLTRAQWRSVAEKGQADLDRERERVACLRSRIVGLYNACRDANARALDFVDVEIPEAVAPGLQAELNGISRDMWRERLADYAHEAWAEWMRHWEKKAIKIDYTIERFGLRWRREDRERWVRQMDTPYAMLPEEEKASDRAQADRILAILRGEG